MTESESTHMALIRTTNKKQENRKATLKLKNMQYTHIKPCRSVIQTEPHIVDVPVVFSHAAVHSSCQSDSCNLSNSHHDFVMNLQEKKNLGTFF